MNRPDLAVQDWKKAQSIHRDADVQTALEKAERDIREEENYRENESAHFQLRYNGAAEPGWHATFCTRWKGITSRSNRAELLAA